MSNDFRSEFLAGGKVGQFVHFGPYAAIGRGEQALWRERLDQAEYAAQARAWRPGDCDVSDWIRQAVALGADYAVLTTRHHDSYCLWPTAEHDYHSQACFSRDLVAEYVDACRAAGIKVGLYYSLADWTCPAYFRGPGPDSSAFTAFIDGIHRQVRELLTNYGDIDIIWFDGCTPHDSPLWRSADLVRMIRELQPGICINSRLGVDVRKGPEHIDGGIGPGDSDRFGDFSIGEGRVLENLGRPWETCATSTRARWGYSVGEAWRSAPEIAEECQRVLTTGGNYMLNVGPDGDGRIPVEYRALAAELGAWLRQARPYLAESRPFGGMTFVNRGWLFHSGNRLLASLRNWDGSGSITFTDFTTAPVAAKLVGSNRTLRITVNGPRCTIDGLPRERTCSLFPLLLLDFAEEPATDLRLSKRNWKPDLSAWQPFADWAAQG